VFQLSRTIAVNDDPQQPTLTRQDVWAGLLLKANNALPYVPQMQKCEVIEQGDGWLVRDILLKDVPMRERVTFESEKRVIFERVDGPEPGRIENVIGVDAKGELTLTFSFSLSKEGLVSGSDAERKHFAPMEGMYFGAVESTLAAVRKTVRERGSLAMGSGGTVDTAGDTRWIVDYYVAADSLDIDRLLKLHTEDTRLAFAGSPVLEGKEGFRAAIGGLFSTIKGMSHQMTGAWSLHDGRIGIAELLVTYTRLDGSQVVIKACTVIRRRGGLVSDIRIHGDFTTL
jgi:ketosteroid isomerase-like protein